MFKTCPVCGVRFYADEPWKRTCLPCWKRSKSADDGFVRIPAHDLQRLRDDLAYWRNAAQNPPAATIPRSFKALINDIIKLAHPDRHGGNDPLATRVTQELLELRREIA